MKLLQKRGKMLFWLHGMWILFAAILLILFVLFWNTIWQVQVRSVSNSMRDTLSIYSQSMDSNLKKIDNFLYLTFSENENLQELEIPSSNSSLGRYLIYHEMSKLLGWCTDICQVMRVGQSDEIQFRVRSPGNISYSDSIAVFDEFCSIATDSEQLKDRLSKGNSFFEAKGSVYIIRYYKIGYSVFGIVIDARKIYNDLADLTASGKEIILADNDMLVRYAPNSSIPVTYLDIQDNGRILPYGDQEYLINMVKLDWGGFYICELVTKTSVVQEIIATNHRWVIMIVLLFISCYGFGILMVSRLVIRPIANLIKGMELFGEGSLQIQVEENSQIEELYQMEHTFNGMTREIQNLKIKNYETQIEKQKAELQYLQLQINPHFYLNALNIIYSLAQLQDYETIQEMSMHLVNYSRYMFHDSTSMVTLNQELQHVREYLRIQEIRFQSSIQYTEHVEKGIGNALIPPFVIQSFVENSVKYAFKLHQQTQILLDGKMEDNYIILTIRDTGEGYSPEALKSINMRPEKPEDAGTHIGIRNVQMRLSILYGERARVECTNDNGAVTKIRLPYIST